MATTSLLLCGHAEAAVQFSMSTQAQNLQVLEDALLSYRGFPAPPLRSSGTLEVVTPDGVLRADKVHGEAGPFVRARGIQYAAHPEGKLRWQPPVPRGPWSGVLDATAYGDDCIQGPFLNRLQEIGPARMSERCLFLNVWAPVVEHEHEHEPPWARGSLPVLVWMHGGSFTSGGTSHYGADRLFSYRRDFVLVTLNYRLGALGWLGGAAVAAESADGSAGNFGLQDSREALRWVARNAAAFGGDPTRVAICGESAGSSMVETHLTAPRSARLFSRAILQSGAFDNYTTQAT